MGKWNDGYGEVPNMIWQDEGGGTVRGRRIWPPSMIESRKNGKVKQLQIIVILGLPLDTRKTQKSPFLLI